MYEKFKTLYNKLPLGYKKYIDVIGYHVNADWECFYNSENVVTLYYNKVYNNKYAFLTHLYCEDCIKYYNTFITYYNKYFVNYDIDKINETIMFVDTRILILQFIRHCDYKHYLC